MQQISNLRHANDMFQSLINFLASDSSMPPNQAEALFPSSMLKTPLFARAWQPAASQNICWNQTSMVTNKAEGMSSSSNCGNKQHINAYCTRSRFFLTCVMRTLWKLYHNSLTSVGHIEVNMKKAHFTNKCEAAAQFSSAAPRFGADHRYVSIARKMENTVAAEGTDKKRTPTIMREKVLYVKEEDHHAVTYFFLWHQQNHGYEWLAFNNNRNHSKAIKKYVTPQQIHPTKPNVKNRKQNDDDDATDIKILLSCVVDCICNNNSR